MIRQQHCEPRTVLAVRIPGVALRDHWGGRYPQDNRGHHHTNQPAGPAAGPGRIVGKLQGGWHPPALHVLWRGV